MLIVALVLWITGLAAPQGPEAIACGEVCEAVLAEGLDWVLVEIQEDGWDRWVDEPGDAILNLHLSPTRTIYQRHSDLYEARKAQFAVLQRLAASRGVPVAIEEHPFAACREDRDPDVCEASEGSFSISVYDVEVVNPTEAMVRVSLSNQAGNTVVWMLRVEQTEGNWYVARASVILMS